MGGSLRLRADYERRLAALADEVELWLRAGELWGGADGRSAAPDAAGPRGLEAVVRERLIPDDETAYAVMGTSSTADARATRDAAVAMALRQLVSLAWLRARARDFLALRLARGPRAAGRRAPAIAHAVAA